MITVRFLGVFAKLGEATSASSGMSARPSAWNVLARIGRIFNEIWYLRSFGSSVEKIQVSLKYDKNNGYFTGGPVQINDYISHRSSYNEKCPR